MYIQLKLQYSQTSMAGSSIALDLEHNENDISVFQKIKVCYVCIYSYNCFNQVFSIFREENYFIIKQYLGIHIVEQDKLIPA